MAETMTNAENCTPMLMYSVTSQPITAITAAAIKAPRALGQASRMIRFISSIAAHPSAGWPKT
jgi:hypothetical protein